MFKYRIFFNAPVSSYKPNTPGGHKSSWIIIRHDHVSNHSTTKPKLVQLPSGRLQTYLHVITGNKSCTTTLAGGCQLRCVTLGLECGMCGKDLLIYFQQEITRVLKGNG